ncbi:protein serine/threonine phosphatase 2C [Rickenella mellea]|uniref:Protein phosphatase n=1 Tax=Rickenella mellea TaxID=50990 RepID=A0A4Y7QIL3_9AGAM|nr:protein serine/threonine phosphatase 2C [Rickenella mellea]
MHLITHRHPRFCSYNLNLNSTRIPVFHQRIPPFRLQSTISHPYKFHIGASWAGKPPDRLRPKVQAPDFASTSDIAKWRAHVLSNYKNINSQHIGEDFFFVQEMRSQSGVALGVADGVGGWVDVGVDPSLFSQALMYHAHRYAKQGWAGEPEIDPTQEYEEREEIEGWEMSPRECLELAHDAVIREKAVNAGSSTACVINLNASSGHLRSANLGDSGFCIIRSSSAIYTQPPQTHFFNCPKQLTKLPSTARRYRGACVDSASQADNFETNLLHGDIVIAFTDGLSDNVFLSEMVNICSLVGRTGGPEINQVQGIADRLVHWATLCMSNRKRVSPFEKAAAREGMYFRGGKIDDVTVVVAMVQETV